jgi:hypothetical protein
MRRWFNVVRQNAVRIQRTTCPTQSVLLLQQNPLELMTGEMGKKRRRTMRFSG